MPRFSPGRCSLIRQPLGKSLGSRTRIELGRVMNVPVLISGALIIINPIAERQWVGIDVSQTSLDIALRPAGMTRQVSTGKGGNSYAANCRLRRSLLSLWWNRPVGWNGESCRSYSHMTSRLQ